MGLRFENLDDKTRRLMIEEIDADVAGLSIYLSNYRPIWASKNGRGLLREAARSGSDDTLAQTLNLRRCFRRETARRKPKGGFTMVR